MLEVFQGGRDTSITLGRAPDAVQGSGRGCCTCAVRATFVVVVTISRFVADE
jgi:hypothetical protein